VINQIYPPQTTLVRTQKTFRFPWLYLLLAYGWAWLWTIPVALTRQDYQSSPLLLLATFIGIFGPGLAGIIRTYREDRTARRDFWQRAFDIRRVRRRWISFMLLLWPALHLLANGLSKALGSEAPASEMVRAMTTQPLVIPVIVVLYFLQATLEDLGWRGYMLEKALQFLRPVSAALFVGIFHAFWHLPFFFIVGTNQIKMGLGFDFWLFVAQAISFSVYATWCYVDNGHSTLAAILLHTVGNLCNDIFTLPGGTLKFQLYTLFMVMGAVVFSSIWSKRKGARK
jgi:membrane protease YdiL (CAAX protease family)